MDIIDYSTEYKEKPSVGKHLAMFPKNIFCVIAGATGCEKIMLLTNLLRREQTLEIFTFIIRLFIRMLI